MLAARREIPIPQEYRQDMDIIELQRDVDKISKQLDRLETAIKEDRASKRENLNAFRLEVQDGFSKMQTKMMELHVESLKRADALHADTLKQYNTIVWKTVGLLGTAAAAAKFILS